LEEIMLDKLTAIVERISTDLGFRELLQQQPDAALASYQLSGEEKGALKDMLSKSEFVGPNLAFWA
jgi:hypothetical protein